MLVLSRRVGEEIIIGGDIRIVILTPKHGSIRIGIEAPSSVPVHRKEVLDREQELMETVDSGQVTF